MRIRALASWLFPAVLGALAACSSDDGGGVEPPANRAPTVSLQFSKIGVVRGASVQLSATVSDPDGDPLTVNWTATRGGAITYQNAERTNVQWGVPSAVGVDTITVVVTDGTASSSTFTAIKVGTLLGQSGVPFTFLKSRSPYIVTLTNNPPVLVINGPVTVIEAGTELLLETPNTVIDVTDSLHAVGTPADPIVIRPNLRNLTCTDDRGWWEGFKVASDLSVDGIVVFDYVELSYGQYSVRLRDGGRAVIRNSTIRCSGQDGILHEGGGTLIVEDTAIRDGLFDGIFIGGATSTFLPDNILVSGCDISFNDRTGIGLNLNDQLQAVPILVEYTNFEFNGLYAMSLERAVFPDIHYNRFYANGVGQGLFNIWLANGFPNGAGVTEIDATCNFWGAPVANDTPIEATIRDSGDTGAVGTNVIASPWSNENPLTTTSTCVVP